MCAGSDLTRHMWKQVMQIVDFLFVFNDGCEVTIVGHELLLTCKAFFGLRFLLVSAKTGLPIGLLKTRLPNG